MDESEWVGVVGLRDHDSCSINERIPGGQCARGGVVEGEGKGGLCCWSRNRF